MSAVRDGGINIVWKLEDIYIRNIYGTYFVLKWPSSDNIFKLTVCKVNSDIATVLTSDTKLMIFGTISVINADNSLTLIKEMNKLCVGKKSSKLDLNLLNTLCTNNYLPSNKALSLLFQFWESSKEKINICYNIWSKPLYQNCCFKWILDVNAKGIGNPPQIKYVKQVPEELTKYSEQEYSLQMTALTEKFSDSKSFSSNKENFNCLTIETSYKVFIKFKLEAIKNDETPLILLDFDWHAIEKIKNYQLEFETLQNLNDDKQIYYPNGYITLMCFMEILPSNTGVAQIEKLDFISENPNSFSFLAKPSKMQNSWSEKNSDYGTLNKSIYKLFEEGQLCDVSLRINKEIIRCHKVVLCARSPVFMAMFQNNMQEKQNGIVDIEDIDSLTLTMFIKALYTDRLDGVTWEDALKIYIVSDKYDVSDLKKWCSDILSSCISKENVCMLFELCDNYHDERLKEKLDKYFFENTKEIIKLPAWKSFMSKKPLFAAELFQQKFSLLP